MKSRFKAFLILSAIFTITAIGAGQVRVDVRLVNVITTVTDTRGRYIANLTAEDFLLEEDGKPQAIAHFSQDRVVPVSVGIALDTSGSMDRRIRTAVEAVERFTRRIHENDEVFLITFSGKPVLRQDFTADRDKLSQALRHVTATGGTALYDAIAEGLAKIKSGNHNKHAMLVITDGRDTASTAKFDDVLRSIRESELLVYPIGISSLSYARTPGMPGMEVPLTAFLSGKPAQKRDDREEVDLEVLQALADNSGARAFLIAETLTSRGGQIEKVLDTIAEELRSQYTLGFYPTHPDDGRYHSLRVRLRTPSAGNVRARRGYVASAS